MEVTFEVKYELGHSYQETWIPDDCRCPECGEKNVWCDESPGDYYLGPKYLCLSCRSEFHISRGGISDKNWQNEQRLAAILKKIRE